MQNKDRLALLRSWVMQGGNAEQCEAAVVLEKKQVSEYTKDRELLKVSEMVARGFSQCLGLLVPLLVEELTCPPIYLR